MEWCLAKDIDGISPHLPTCGSTDLIRHVISNLDGTILAFSILIVKKPWQVESYGVAEAIWLQ